MIVAEKPLNEELRLQDLASYDIMDTVPEDEFNELVELAGQISNCPISLISLIDKDRQWFKAKKGLDADSTSRDIAFCSHAILQDDIMLVEDATKDERFHDNPLVTGDLNIRFYAGAPIVSAAGYKLGTLCIIDSKPQKPTKAVKRALTILSNQVTKLLELRLKNKIIRQRAEEILTIKTNTINKLIQMQEEDKKSIAENLHENLAQTIASTIFYVKMAEEDPARSLDMLHKAKEQLQGVAVGMRNLSYEIMPPSLNLIHSEEMIKNYVDQIAITFPFEIRMKIGEVSADILPNQILTAIRIIEQWLKLLAERRGVTEVDILVKSGKNLTLEIEDNGPAVNFEKMKQEIFDNMIYQRVNAQGGVVDLSILKTGKNLLTVSMPLEIGKLQNVTS